MYSGPGAQVCTNAPFPAFNGHGSNHGYPQYGNGFHPNAPYFSPAGCSQYPPQNNSNFGPVDTRYTQHSKDQRNKVFQAPVGPPMPSMNMPIPFMQFAGQFPPFPYSMPHQNQYFPQNGMVVNQFSNPPPYPPPYPNAMNNNYNNNKYNNGRSLNGMKSRSFGPTDDKFAPAQMKPFHCGSCDRDFNTSFQYEKHVAEHVDCCLDGCTFRAHPSIVEKHIAMQHRNGLYKRIVKGDSPEEIEKWVTDRKKLYPTLGKITEKQIQKIEMDKRGERYDDRRQGFRNRNNNSKDTRNHPKFPYNNKKSFGCNAKRIDSKSDDTANQTPNRSFKTPTKKKEYHNSVLGSFEYQRNLPAFRGTKYYLQCQTVKDEPDYSNSDSGEGSLCSNTAAVCDDEVSISDKSSQPIFSLQLIRGYDSSDDSNDDCDEAETSAVTKPELSSINISVSSSMDEYPSKLSLFDTPIEPELSSINISVPSSTDEYPSNLSLFDDTPIKSESYPSDEDDDSGPEECSFELPVPDFILQDTSIKSDSHPPDDDDSGPEECSSKLPLPDFILQDSIVESVNMNAGDTKSVPPKLPEPEPQNKSSPVEKKNDCDTAKKSTRKRVHRKNRNEKVDESAESVEKKETEKVECEPATIIPRKRFRRSTLLEKLLAPEIRHERNTILQCIRYVVKNNYFNIGSTSAAGTSSR